MVWRTPETTSRWALEWMSETRPHTTRMWTLGTCKACSIATTAGEPQNRHSDEVQSVHLVLSSLLRNQETEVVAAGTNVVEEGARAASVMTTRGSETVDGGGVAADVTAVGGADGEEGATATSTAIGDATIFCCRHRSHRSEASPALIFAIAASSLTRSYCMVAGGKRRAWNRLAAGKAEESPV
jgi:hypothetical protein